MSRRCEGLCWLGRPFVIRNRLPPVIALEALFLPVVELAFIRVGQSHSGCYLGGWRRHDHRARRNVE